VAPHSHLYRVSRPGGPLAHKPVVAVLEFENRSGFSGQWNLGGGMADLLTTYLLETDRFIVLERRNLTHLVGEIRRQADGLFRKEGRAKPGRLKNAQYLVRGVVTDFTVTGDASGWFSKEKTRARGWGSRARVAMNLMVSEVETGQIVSSVKTSGSAGAWGFSGLINYRNVTFGSDAFFRTPLGRATGEAITRAIHQIARDLPILPWQLRVAERHGQEVVLNGGENAGIREGTAYVVRAEPHEVTDPVSGDVIEVVPGRLKGKIRVHTVKARSSRGILLSGTAERGDLLKPAPATSGLPPAAGPTTRGRVRGPAKP
jgi:curli biogenesis system outer membrane secretion channel CsgG